MQLNYPTVTYKILGKLYPNCFTFKTSSSFYLNQILIFKEAPKQIQNLKTQIVIYIYIYIYIYKKQTSSSSGMHTVSSNSLVFSIVRGVFFSGSCKIELKFKQKPKTNSPSNPYKYIYIYIHIYKIGEPLRRAQERA